MVVLLKILEEIRAQGIAAQSRGLIQNLRLKSGHSLSWYARPRCRGWSDSRFRTHGVVTGQFHFYKSRFIDGYWLYYRLIYHGLACKIILSKIPTTFSLAWPTKLSIKCVANKVKFFCTVNSVVVSCGLWR